MHDGALQVLVAVLHLTCSSEERGRLWEALGLNRASSSTATNDLRAPPPVVSDGVKWVLYHLGFVRARKLDVVMLEPVRLAVDKLSPYVQKHDRGVVLSERVWPEAFPPLHFINSHWVSTFKSTFMSDKKYTRRDAALGLLSRIASAMEPVQSFPAQERWRVFSEGLLFGKATLIDGQEVMFPACMPFDMKFTEPYRAESSGLYVSPTKRGRYLQLTVGKEEVDVRVGEGGAVPTRSSPRVLGRSSGSVPGSALSGADTPALSSSHQPSFTSSLGSGSQGESCVSEAATSGGGLTSSVVTRTSVPGRKTRPVRTRAHQVIAALFWGPPPPGKDLTDVAHLCGRYQCLNPLHLQHTTRTVNNMQTPEYIRVHGMEALGISNGMWGFDSLVDSMYEAV